MEIKLIEDKQVWEDFGRQFHPNNFLQSWNFGRFNADDGDPP